MNKLTINIILILLVIAITGSHCWNIRDNIRSIHQVSAVDGDKLLNNAISFAIGNAIESGDFKTVQVTSNDLSATTGTCTRNVIGTDFSDPNTYTGSLRTVYDSNQVRVGVSNIHNDPAFFADNGGEPSGYLADVVRIMSSHLGLVLGVNIDPVFVVYNGSNFFDDSVALLENGDADTVIDITYLVSRLNRTDFTCAYERAIPFAVFRDQAAALPGGFTLPKTLEGWNNENIKVATVAGTVYSAAADKFLPKAQKVEFASASEAFDSVGKTTDITFYDTASLIVYNSVNNNRLGLQTGTQIVFAGGTGFITKKTM